MQLILSPAALKKLGKINPKDKKKIEKKLLKLAQDPLIGKSLKGDHEGQYSLRAWPLRIIYTFNPTKHIVEIIAIDYRGKVYRN